MNDKGLPEIGPRQIKAFMDRVIAPELAGVGLTPSSGAYIRIIACKEGISMKGISDELMGDKAMTTRTVSALIAQGFVENTGEGHAYSLRLTDKGRNADKVVDSAIHRAYNELFRYVTPEERETYNAVSKKMSQVIREDTQ